MIKFWRYINITKERMKYFSIFAFLLVVSSSCTQSNKTEHPDSVVDSTMAITDSLIKQEERVNEHYRQITESLEEIIFEHNSFDYVPVNAQTIAWYKKCKKELVKAYDSNNPIFEISDNAKVDSLFRELEFYYELDSNEDLSKHRGVGVQRMKKSILLFHITEKTLAMLQQDSSFVKEQMAWERFQKALEEYYLTAEEILYTGGTGNVVLCLMAMNDIYKNRDNDLARMLNNNSNDTKRILAARGKFLHSVDSIEKELYEEFTKEEWKIFEDIPQLLDKMHKARRPLIIALDEWISERKRYNGCANAIIDLNNTISSVK